MYVETSPGSRMKTCDTCGTQMLEQYPGRIIPAYDLRNYIVDGLENMCPTCRENYDEFVRLSIRRTKWSEFGVRPRLKKEED